MHISTNNILQLQLEGNLKKLSVFIFLKGLYSNSCIFNYNIKSLSKKSGLSRHLIRKNVKFFLLNDWCSMHNGNLIFRKYEKKPLEKKEWIIRKRTMFVGKKIDEITTILLSLVLKQKESNYNWIQEKKRDLEKSQTTEFISLDTYKKAIKAQKKYNIACGESGNFKMTINSIGELFGVSKSNISNLIKKMQQMQLVRVTGYYPEYIGECTAAMWKAIQGEPGIIWLPKKNMAFKKKCNEYAFF